MRSKIVSIVSILLAIWPAPGGAQQKDLKIVVLEGDGAFNDIKRRAARNQIVEVRDVSGQPVEGAQVVFTLPEDGPSGSFAGGVRKFMTTTDAQGRAATRDLKPNAREGRFNTKVTASAGGASGSVLISQRNTLAGGMVSAEKGGGSKIKILLAVVIAAGVAGGVYAATHRGGSSATVAPPISTTLSGTVTVGGPR